MPRKTRMYLPGIPVRKPGKIYFPDLFSENRDRFIFCTRGIGILEGLIEAVGLDLWEGYNSDLRTQRWNSSGEMDVFRRCHGCLT